MVAEKKCLLGAPLIPDVGMSGTSPTPSKSRMCGAPEFQRNGTGGSISGVWIGAPAPMAMSTALPPGFNSGSASSFQLSGNQSAGQHRRSVNGLDEEDRLFLASGGSELCANCQE